MAGYYHGNKRAGPGGMGWGLVNCSGKPRAGAQKAAWQCQGIVSSTAWGGCWLHGSHTPCMERRLMFLRCKKLGDSLAQCASQTCLFKSITWSLASFNIIARFFPWRFSLGEAEEGPRHPDVSQVPCWSLRSSTFV